MQKRKNPEKGREQNPRIFFFFFFDLLGSVNRLDQLKMAET